MENGILFQAIIYLSAALLCVPISKKLGMGSVLGYLLAGILIGPYLLGFIGQEGKDIMHFAEFGVVMMLFLIGLELEPAKLWKMRKTITSVGLTQVIGTTLLLFIALMLINFKWQPALAIAMSLSLSSTAIVLQSLKEKNQFNTAAGQSSFSVLLMQDIAVIPILAVLPLLAINNVDVSNQSHSPIHNLPSWLQTLSLLGAVAVVILAGRFIVIPVFRIIAKTRLRELFTAASLLLIISIAFLMEVVGLSPALGTFLAGVVLANSEFKHELEADLEPFKGLLLGLFFIAVGASINFNLIIENVQIILLATMGVLLIKATILGLIGKISKLSTDQNLIFSLGLSQIGEFAFVTFSFAGQLLIIDQNMMESLMAITALSMTFTPILNLINERFILPKFGTKEKDNSKEADHIDESNEVIIAGFSHYGSTVGRLLRANGVNATILDHDSDRVDLLRKLGFKVYYGDATRIDLLESAGAEKAKIFISAIDNHDVNAQLSEIIHKHFPHLEFVVRAKNRFEAYKLMNLNVNQIYRDHLDSSVRMGKDVLIKLGKRAHSMQRVAQNFIQYDEAAMRDLAKFTENQKEYIFNAKKHIEMQETMLAKEINLNFSINDKSWDSEEIKNTINAISKAN